MDPYTSVLAIGCVALDEGLMNFVSQFPHVSNKNNNLELSGRCHWVAENSYHHLGPDIREEESRTRSSGTQKQ